MIRYDLKEKKEELSMITFKDITTVYDEITIDELVNDYVRRQRNNIKQDNKAFQNFLETLERDLHTIGIHPFKRTMLSEFAHYINKSENKDMLLEYFNILLEITKPQTTDPKIRSSLEWQMTQTLKKSYNEYSYDDKYEIIFQIIFEYFNRNSQKRFLELLKRHNYNPSLDLLEVMTFIRKYYDNEWSFEELKRYSHILTTVIDIQKTPYSIIVNTIYGEVEFYFATETLAIKDISKLEQGGCHFVTSEYLEEFPHLYGAYYYIPNYFKGDIEHSVLINYKEGLVYDLSHNIVLPLEQFTRYYGLPKFTISGEEFAELSNKVQEKYDTPLYLHHIEQVKRHLKR